jgi:hypothetical protein
MTFGEEWGWGSSKEENRGIYDRFRDLGGNFVETANLYTNGASEYYPGDTKNLRYAKGEGMTHDLENVGTKDLRFITVEFLDSENSPLPLPSGF